MHWASRFASYFSLPYISAASEVVSLQVHSSCPLALQSLPPRPFPKIPSKLFQDLSLEGSLWLIVTKCHEAMGARGLKRVDFTNPLHRVQASALTQLRQEAVGVSRLAAAACQCFTSVLTDSPVFCCLQFKDILAQVMHELIKQGFLKWPKVFVHPTCGPEVPLLQKLVTELRGEVATSAGDCLYLHYLDSIALMSPALMEVLHHEQVPGRDCCIKVLLNGNRMLLQTPLV